MSEAVLFAEHGENMLCTKIVLNTRNNFCTQHALPRFERGIFMYWTCNSMNNLSPYFGLVDAKIRASDKDLPAQHSVGLPVRWTVLFYPRKEQDNIIRLITNDLNKSTLKTIKLIGTNSRFAKIQQKAQEQKWLKIEHLAIGLVAKKYTKLRKTSVVVLYFPLC